MFAECPEFCLNRKYPFCRQIFSNSKQFYKHGLCRLKLFPGLTSWLIDWIGLGTFYHSFGPLSSNFNVEYGNRLVPPRPLRKSFQSPVISKLTPFFILRERFVSAYSVTKVSLLLVFWRDMKELILETKNYPAILVASLFSVSVTWRHIIWHTLARSHLPVPIVKNLSLMHLLWRLIWPYTPERNHIRNHISPSPIPVVWKPIIESTQGRNLSCVPSVTRLLTSEETWLHILEHTYEKNNKPALHWQLFLYI